MEKILKSSLDLIPSPSPSMKIQDMGRKICLRCKGKRLLTKQKVCWHHPAMFCLIKSSKLSRQLFEFSLKMKVMGLNSVYLLKSFLPYPTWRYRDFFHFNLFSVAKENFLVSGFEKSSYTFFYNKNDKQTFIGWISQYLV